ncbi:MULTISPECIES: class F sortase [Streptomyces]|jgi:hypothetical protein|nr:MULTISPECIES: class F sortase [Streptomyces]
MALRDFTSAFRRPSFPAVLLLICAVAAGAVLLLGGEQNEKPPRPSAAQALLPSVHPTTRGLPPADPVRIRIAAIGVDAPMTPLGLDAAGTLQTPPRDKADVAGWYGDGTTPGSAGTAIVAGHVDTPTGAPGVFYNLGALTKGATIEISRVDRKTAVFTVRAVELYEREKFPSKKVYGSTGRPELRLITCGGDYVKGTGYLGNIVVYAALTAVT